MSKLKLMACVLVALLVFGCGDSKKKETTSEPKKEAPKSIDPKEDKGVGPVKNIELAEIDEAMAKEGQEIFKIKCSACHKMERRFVGPLLKGITERRTPEWIMNMILAPEKMVAENEAAKKLLTEYLSPMANQNLTHDEARKILEYFRTEK